MSGEKRRALSQICLFSGSQDGHEDIFLKTAKDLGKELANRKLTLIYGGGSQGLMGATALACHEKGGKVLGIIPDYLDQPPVKENDCYEKQVVSSLFERKKLMFEKADAFIALPGGIGTLDEISEVLALIQLDQLAKPLGLLNVLNYYDPLLNVLSHFKQNGFLYTKIEENICVSDDVYELLDRIKRLV